MSVKTGEMSGELGQKPIYEVVRALHAAGGSGVLEVNVGEVKRRLYFEEGQLWLAATHPLARHLGELVGKLATPGPEQAEAKLKCTDLVQRMANLVADWRKGSYHFDGDPASLPAERIGPLPTERLVMLAATAGLEEPALMARLGGLAAQLTARPSFREPDALGLVPEEAFLIERLRQPMTLENLLGDSPVPRIEALRRLVQLKVVGRIRVLGRDGSDPRQLPQLLAPEVELAKRLSERFERGLKEEPLALPVEEFRQKISDLFARIGGMNAYEILEVDPSATNERVQARYEELSRLVHPANEAAYGLTGVKPMLDLLFERATEAYFTLVDGERRRRYNEAQSIDLGTGAAGGANRELEQRELGRQHYEQGLAHSARGEFHTAIQLLEIAAKTDPKVDYLLALARVQARNPKWISRAVESCRSALELEPHNADIRFQLGELYEAAGERPRARAQFSAALRENPGHTQAAAKLRAIEAAIAESRSPAGGLFDRLFGRRE